MDKVKFEYPSRGFYLVTQKVAEADFFIEKMKNCGLLDSNFKHYLSAFSSAARSITFCLQYSMEDYPGFAEWYPTQQEILKDDRLAKFFVKIRNESQKRGVIWIEESGVGDKNGWTIFRKFTNGPNSDIKEIPPGEIINLCVEYFCSILIVLEKFYRDFDVYVDPRVLFTQRGLHALGWSIEDLEEYLGFPRGWTNIPLDGNDKDEQRLNALRRYGFDEELEEFLLKYGITYKRNN